MNENRLDDYFKHMFKAASEACGFVENMSMEDFLTDRRTQQAVIMNLIIIGEAATKIINNYPEAVEAYPEIPWRSMRGMRNRITHGYFDINLDIVWDTVKTALPDLLSRLPKV